MSKPLYIIILAADDGIRMKSRLPKVLHTVGGRSMLVHVHQAASALSPQSIHVVFNPSAPEVKQVLDGNEVEWVAQHERLGPGDAVQRAMPGIPDEASVLVLNGDLPLLTEELLRDLIDAPDAGLKVLTMRLSDSAAEQQAIDAVNTGIVMADAGNLKRWLSALDHENSQEEHWLNGIFAIANREHAAVERVEANDLRALKSASDRVQLAELERHYRDRAAERLMLSGVRIADPQRVELRGNVNAGRDVSIDINVVLEGEVSLGEGVQIGPGCVIRDCDLAAGTRVHPYSVIEGVRTSGACDIGPFARIRPGTVLGEGSRVGNFVEVKNSSLGDGTKASHLSYLGDSTIGRDVNIGAGTITCNYDGANKHRTVIEDGVFVGSDTQLVAPVTVGKNANIGAGSTITKDAPEGKLTLSRAKQVTVPGWKRPKKG